MLRMATHAISTERDHTATCGLKLEEVMLMRGNQDSFREAFATGLT